LAKALAQPWTQTTTEDLRFPATEGRRVFSHKIIRAYVDRVFLLSATHPEVRLALWNVLGMIKAPTHLFKPSLLWRVLRTRIPRNRVRPQQALGPNRATAPGSPSCT
jgi:hypothetical protein